MRSAATIFALIFPTIAHAQAPVGSDTLSRRAVAESLKVLDQLGKSVKANPKDARAWFHRALLAFALAERADQDDRAPGMNLSHRELRIAASDAFTAALNLDPKNNTYKHAFDQFHLTDHSSLARAAGRPRNCVTDSTHFASEPDPALRLTLVLDMGWICWMDYDGYEGRAISAFERSGADMGSAARALTAKPKDGAPMSVVGAAAFFLREAVDPCRGEPLPLGPIMATAIDSVLAMLSPAPFDVAGEGDYLRSRVMFERAYAMNLNDSRAFTSLAMLLAARDNWPALQALARNQTRVAPSDPWAWMALALATYRAHPDRESAALFDSAFARLDVKDRERLDQFERVLRPVDVARFRKEDPANRENIVRTSWLLADPLWSVPHADPRTEFLARVTYAELRWSLNGWQVHGAETERGNIYIRYGPPNKMLGYAPLTTDSLGQKMFTFWIYNADLIFAFAKNLHRGTAQIAPCDAQMAERTIETQPARWDNIATTRIDSMPTQVARFRARADSIDIYLATEAPLKPMRDAAVNGDAFAHLWLLPRGPGESFTDTVRVAPTGLLQWTHRLRPGPYYYRVEAMIPGTLVAGRTTASMMIGPDSASGFRSLGFGLSDILIAAHASARIPPRRWTDIELIPSLGAVARGSEVSLVWENYELGNQNDEARYEIVISMQRETGKSTAPIVAKITGLLANAVGTTSSKDKIAMRIDRAVPFAPVVTENLTLALGTTPAGTYRLTVQVTDRTSRRVATSSARIAIRDQ